MDEPISEAIIRAGGVSSVFRRKIDPSSVSAIKLCLEGEYLYIQTAYTRNHQRKGRYRYELSINRSAETGVVYFDRQNFKLSITTKQGRFRQTKGGKDIWDLEVDSHVNETLHPEITIDRLNTKKIRPQIYHGAYSKSMLQRLLIPRIARADPSVFSFIHILDQIFQEVRNIRTDLYSGRAYNISPSAVKSREDAVFPVGIQSDGTGTSSTLFTLQKIADRRENQVRPPRVYQGSATSRRLDLNDRIYKEVLDLLRLVNSAITGVRIFVDPYDNILRVLFGIETKEGALEVPFQNMSDGTAKWLALTIAILSNRGVFAIEEPENFLHPYMQNEILQIIRDSMSDYGRRGFAILTTHSETLLNAAKPEEIIIVKMEDGNTITSRILDPARIDEEIRRSGFGLGYLYLTGVLSNA
jgi:hypothetical protein